MRGDKPVGLSFIIHNNCNSLSLDLSVNNEDVTDIDKTIKSISQQNSYEHAYLVTQIFPSIHFNSIASVSNAKRLWTKEATFWGLDNWNLGY